MRESKVATKSNCSMTLAATDNNGAQIVKKKNYDDNENDNTFLA